VTFATIEEALADMAAGKMIIVVDDEERENEGDFITAAETVTPEQVNFIAREAGIQLCVGLTRERFEQLSIPMMVADNTAPHQTAFGVSVDLKVPQHTGSSAFDRAAARRHAGASYRELAADEAMLVDFTSGPLKDLLDSLSAFRRCQVRALYDDGMSMAELGRALGVTRQRVAVLLGTKESRQEG